MFSKTPAIDPVIREGNEPRPDCIYEPEYQRIDDMCRARRFIEEQTWKFAKTTPQIPHFYCLKGLCPDPGEFEWFVGYLLEHSVSGEFYGKTYRYIYLDHWKYWIMDKGPKDCNLINREHQSGKTSMSPKEQYKQDINAFARTLYAYLKEHCVGRELSTRTLVESAVKPVPAYDKRGKLINPNPPFYPFTDDELWDVHYALWRIVRQGRKYELNFDKYGDTPTGLPYNVPFVFRLKQ